MSIPPPSERRGWWRDLRRAFSRVPRRILVRFLIFVGILAVGLAILRWPPVARHLERENVLAMLEAVRSHWWSPLVLIALYFAGAVGMPASPLVIGGGAIFGVWLGSLYNLIGLLLGAWLSFVLGRLFGRELVAHIAGGKLRRAERLFHRRGFWPLVSLRFLPVPYPLINYGAALAGVRPGQFLLSSAIGLAPANLMHTFFAAWMTTAAEDRRLLVGILWGGSWALLAALTALPAFREARRRRRRYAHLLGRRRDRLMLD